MTLLDSLPGIIDAIGEDKVNAVANMITSNTDAVEDDSSQGFTLNDLVSSASNLFTSTINDIGNTQVQTAVETGIQTAAQIVNTNGTNLDSNNSASETVVDTHQEPAISHVKDSTTDSNYIDQKRTVEMYVYQEKKYQAYLDILNQFTFYCIILLILAILKKRFIISYSFTQILIMILIVISGIHMYLKIADVNMRNNIDFDEYDWSFSADSQSDPNKIDTNLHNERQKEGASCVEAACCNTDFTKWCATQGLCISKDTYCPGEENDDVKSNNLVKGWSRDTKSIKNVSGINEWSGCVIEAKKVNAPYWIHRNSKHTNMPNSCDLKSWSAPYSGDDSDDINLSGCSYGGNPKNGCNPKFTVGDTVQCNANDVGSGVNSALYRVVEDDVLRHYPNQSIASSWDPDWDSTFKKIDCIGLTPGENMAVKSS